MAKNSKKKTEDEVLEVENFDIKAVDDNLKTVLIEDEDSVELENCDSIDDSQETKEDIATYNEIEIEDIDVKSVEEVGKQDNNVEETQKDITPQRLNKCFNFTWNGISYN